MYSLKALILPGFELVGSLGPVYKWLFYGFSSHHSGEVGLVEPHTPQQVILVIHACLDHGGIVQVRREASAVLAKSDGAGGKMSGLIHGSYIQCR